MVTLTFNNPEAEVPTTTLQLGGLHEVDHVLAWYGSFWAGDDYSVFLNGRPLEIDHNGERAHKVIGGENVPYSLKEINSKGA